MSRLARIRPVQAGALLVVGLGVTLWSAFGVVSAGEVPAELPPVVEEPVHAGGSGARRVAPQPRVPSPVPAATTPGAAAPRNPFAGDGR